MLFLEKGSQSHFAGNGKVPSSLEGHCSLRTKLTKAGRFNQDTIVGPSHTCVIIPLSYYIIYLMIWETATNYKYDHALLWKRECVQFFFL